MGIIMNPAAWGWAAVIVAMIVVAAQIWWQLKIAKEQLRVNFYLKLRDQFDSLEFRKARQFLAQQLLAKDFQQGSMRTPSHEEISETVMNFFEDMGMLYRRNYLDHEMIIQTFSYHGLGWWNACKAYILEERRRHKGDQTLFCDFEKLTTIWAGLPVPGVSDFLHEELKLY